MNCRATGTRPRVRVAATTAPRLGVPHAVDVATPEVRSGCLAVVMFALVVFGIGGGMGYLMFSIIRAAVWS